MITALIKKDLFNAKKGWIQWLISEMLPNENYFITKTKRELEPYRVIAVELLIFVQKKGAVEKKKTWPLTLWN